MQKLQNLISFFTKPRLLSLAPKDDKDVDLKLSEILMRVLIGIATVFWMAILPLYLFVIYMIKNKFFSYELFVDELFGVNVFIFTFLFSIFAISVAFFGFMIFLKLGVKQQKYENKNSWRPLFYFFLFISFVVNFLFWVTAIANDKVEIASWIFLLSFFFFVFIYTFVGHNFKANIQNWKSPLALVVATVILPILSTNITSEMVASSLRNFRIGGEIQAEIFDTKTDKLMSSGKLIFLSPKSVYLNKNNKLIVVPISQHSEIVIGDKM